MSWGVELSNAARRDLRGMDKRMAERVLDALDRLATTDRGDVRKLKGREAEWRLRVGEWRVIFTFLNETRTLFVLRVLPRGEAYR